MAFLKLEPFSGKGVLIPVIKTKGQMKSGNFTGGIIWKQLILFALPLLGSSFIQQLYNTVDLIFVGRFIGKEASAAIGASSLIITCLVGFFSGMSVGSSVVISQIFGSNDKIRLRRAVHSAIGLSLIGGFFLMGIGYIGAPVFLKWMNTPVSILPTAVSYLRIYFLSLVSILLYNIGAGILRAVGNSRVPMYCQLFGGIINVIMDAVFVVAFKNGINGVAWATLLSQSAAGLLVFFYLMRTPEGFRVEIKNLRIHIDIFKEILKVGIPAGIQSLVITLSNVFAQYHINGLGVDAIAAFTAYFKVELVMYLPIVALGQTIMTFSGQNYGAGKYKRVRQGTKMCICLGIGLIVSIGILTLVFIEPAFGIFTRDASVIYYGKRIAQISFPFYGISVILEILGGAIRGMGKAIPPMIIILLNICLLRSILLFVLMPIYPDVRTVAATYPITWTTTAICMTLCSKRFLQKKCNVR